MSDLEVRQLRYFVAVAEELHFGRAANRLGMAQPPLSRAIREIERQLGVTLLERTTRRVALTAAGEVLLRDARTALAAVTAAGRRAQHAGRSEPTLRLAMKADYDGGLLPQILAAYRAEPAALPLQFVLGGRAQQEPALRDGRADIALLQRPFDDRGLDVEPLLTEPRLLAVAATDPLTAHEQLHLADLKGRFLPDGRAADREDLPPVRATGPGPDGQPARQPRQLDLAQIFNLVELGDSVWFPPASIVRRHPRPGIVHRPVVDLPPLQLALAWPQESRSPAVAAFVRTACEVAAATAPMGTGMATATGT
ncbi:LysR substrate-binding domain-containing protein [Streptomyces spinosirectus]|uniref:LysR family transcriptional regulator n=1 Tax=Streptomyces spinosirectus TaxID=2906474 RepID=UPI001F465F04|nr:LysR substrate-binding domain-containing protein [Streptomyces spinosirectus]UIR21963.1 LysR substrate-binding domain-containing protein [Streptomyces spinosirectus]